MNRCRNTVNLAAVALWGAWECLRASPAPTRFSLALILLLIAPSAWGQTNNLCIHDAHGGTCYTSDNRCKPDEVRLGDQCVKVIENVEPRGVTIPGSGGSGAECEPGWELVMRLNFGGTPLCAWVLKEPIHK